MPRRLRSRGPNSITRSERTVTAADTLQFKIPRAGGFAAPVKVEEAKVTRVEETSEYTALISDRVYPTLGVEKLFMRSAVVLVVAVLAAYFPAREAARHEPAIALHTV